MSGDAQSLENKRAGEVARMRELLEDWKEILVHVKRVVDWEEQFHPAVVFGVVSLLYLLIWYVEPTFLSFVSLVCLVITLADYLLPLALPRLLDVDNWTDDSRTRYGEICASIVGFKYESRALFFRAQQMKADRPRLYLALTSVALLFLAWIGSALGDFTLLYLISLGVCLYPGAMKNPVVRANVDNVMERVKGLLAKDKAN